MGRLKVPTIILQSSDRGRLGPAMTKLNDRQRKFVWAMLDTGAANYTACAAAAGYASENQQSLRVNAHRLAHDEDIQAAIQEEARKRMGAAQIMAVSHLVNIAGNEAHKDQLSAIKEILNRSGLQGITEHKVSVTHSLDREGMIKQIAQLAELQGMDPRKLLGSYGVTVDAEFTEIEQSDDGLEDLL